jgi:hypothetical protein
MSGKEIKYVTVGFKVPEEVRDRWARLAEETGNSLSEFLRRAAAGLEENLRSLPTKRQNDGRVLDLLGEILEAVKGKDFGENVKSEPSAQPDILDLARQAPTYEEEPEIVAEEMPVAALEEAAKVPVLDKNGRIKLKQVDWKEQNLLVKMGAKKDQIHGHFFVPEGVDPEPFRGFFA